MAINRIKAFIQLESFSGFLLFGATLLAMLFSNGSHSEAFNHIWSYPLSFHLGFFKLNKPLLLWINEGLMTLFFYVVTLEMKHDFTSGALNTWKKASLPAIGALGGMVVPIFIYTLFSWNRPSLHLGWAIPAATDIAFSLAILSLFRSRIPPLVKTLLTAIAIFDDLGAILIIAFFYTSKIHWIYLLSSLLCMMVLFLLNRWVKSHTWPYYLVGLLLWIAAIKSGLHATLTGVMVALALPYPLIGQKKLLERSHPYVSYMILPLFALANAGIDLRVIDWVHLTHPIVPAITLALWLGKPLGIYGFSMMFAHLGLTTLPMGLSRRHLFTIGAFCGIGFTMSLFIGALAYADYPLDYLYRIKMGVILGSLLSAFMGGLILTFMQKGERP